MNKVHKKCQKESRRLRRLLKHERNEAKKLASVAANKNHRSIQIVKVLKDCVKALEERRDVVKSEIAEKVHNDVSPGHTDKRLGNGNIYIRWTCSRRTHT